MGLTNVNPAVDRMVAAMRALGAATRFIGVTWSGGDLPMRNVLAIEQAYAQVAQAVYEIEQEAVANLAEVEAAVASRGGPATAAEFVAEWDAVNTAGAAWITYVESVYHQLPKSSLVWIETVSIGGVTYPQTRTIQNLPDAAGQALKASSELAALRAALVAIGVSNA